MQNFLLFLLSHGFDAVLVLSMCVSCCDDEEAEPDTRISQRR